MGNIKDGSAVFIVRKIGLLYGCIMAFSGKFDDYGHPIDIDTGLADTGWHICDGTHGTPDLRGRFILGASDSHAVGSTGGEENHTLNVGEMPSHSHVLYGSDNGTSHTNYSDSPSTRNWTQTYRNWANSIAPTGGSQPHNNMPPYYTLSYIMKI